MYPSQVRERILRDHEQLQVRLQALEEAVNAMAGDPGRFESVVETSRALLEQFVTHTELEDRILGAALLDIDAWGPVRARNLREHHATQRRELRELLVTYRHIQSREDVARITRHWIGDVRSDMQHEETDLLTPTLLHDDVIAVAMECG
jgi:hypothetical protein